jgi:hypothetical protein
MYVSQLLVTVSSMETVGRCAPLAGTEVGDTQTVLVVLVCFTNRVRVSVCAGMSCLIVAVDEKSAV